MRIGNCAPLVAAGWLVFSAALCAEPASDPAVLRQKTLEAQILLDEHYGDNGQLRQAADLLSEVFAQDPQFVPALAQLARLVLKNGYLYRDKSTAGTRESAEQILLEAARLDPGYAETYSLLGHVYTRLGRFDEAKAALDKARALGSRNPWTQVNLGSLYKKQGKDKEAEQVMKAVVAAGRNETAQQRRAVQAALEALRGMAVQAGDLDGLIKYGQLSIDAAPPHDAWTLGNYANDLVQLGEYAAAVNQARAALERMEYGAGRRTLAEALYGLWHQYLKAGMRAEAEECFAEAVRIMPDLGEAARRFTGLPHLMEVRDRLMQRAREQPAPR